jgi:polyhydroxyalkanoate synthase
VGSTAFIVVSVVGCWALAMLVTRRLAGPPPRADERHEVRTDDGWTLTLHRYRPAAGLARQPVPVVFGHGFTMNGHCWELSAEGSLPRALAARGHDVFVADYRGTRSSRPPLGSGRMGRWRFGPLDHACRDFPAIINAAANLAGSERVSWVGHSMGGMLLYVYASRFGSDRLHRVVTLGSPMRFGHFARLMAGVPRFASFMLRHVPAFRVRPLVLLAAPFVVLLPFIGAIAAGGSWLLSMRERAALLWVSFESTSAPVARWFAEMNVRRQTLCPEAGAGPDAGPEPGGLARLDAPLLVLAGVRDLLAPPAAVRPAFDRAGGPTVAWKLFGDPGAKSALEAGPRFGHSDMISSRAAASHTLPALAAWLEGEEPLAPAGAESRGQPAGDAAPRAAG